MFGLKRIGAGLVCVVLGAAGAQAQELQLVEKIGDWNLYYSEALGDSCLVERTDADGRQLQFGVDRKKEQAYAGLFAKEDAGMVAGDLVDVSFELGDTVFTGEATQYNKDGIQGGYVYFNNLDFAYELAKQQTLIINPAEGDPIPVDLTGSLNAIEAMIACQIATAQ